MTKATPMTDPAETFDPTRALLAQAREQLGCQCSHCRATWPASASGEAAPGDAKESDAKHEKQTRSACDVCRGECTTDSGYSACATCLATGYTTPALRDCIALARRTVAAKAEREGRFVPPPHDLLRAADWLDGPDDHADEKDQASFYRVAGYLRTLAGTSI